MSRTNRNHQRSAGYGCFYEKARWSQCVRSGDVTDPIFTTSSQGATEAGVFDAVPHPPVPWPRGAPDLGRSLDGDIGGFS